MRTLRHSCSKHQASATLLRRARDQFIRDSKKEWRLDVVAGERTQAQTGIDEIDNDGVRIEVGIGFEPGDQFAGQEDLK